MGQRKVWVRNRWNKDGRKYEVLEEFHDTYRLNAPGTHVYIVPKAEFIECDAPEKWVTVGKTFSVFQQHVVTLDGGMAIVLPEDHRFVVRNDGFLNIEKKVLDN